MTPPAMTPLPFRNAIEVGAIIQALRAGARTIGLAAGGGLVLGTLVTLALPRTFESYASVRIDPFVVDQLTQTGRNANIDDDALTIEARSDAVLTEAGRGLDPPRTIEDLRPLVSVTQAGNSSVLEIAARAGDPETAADLANRVASAMVDVRADRIDTELIQAASALSEQIEATRADLVELDGELAARTDPDLLIARNNLDQRLQLLTEIATRSDHGGPEATGNIDGAIATVRTELTELDRQLLVQRDPELALRRNALAEELSLLSELQIRAQVHAALPGEVLRSAKPPSAPTGTPALVNGLALGVLAGAGAWLVHGIRQRSLITRRDIDSVFGPVLAEIPAISSMGPSPIERDAFRPTQEGAASALDAELRRLDLWLWVQGARSPLFISTGDGPVASGLVRHLGRHRAVHMTTRVIDFERRILADASPTDGVEVIEPQTIADLRSEVFGQGYVMVAPPIVRSPDTLEAALTADAIVLVIDLSSVHYRSSVRYRDVMDDVERLRTIGLEVGGVVLVSGDANAPGAIDASAATVDGAGIGALVGPGAARSGSHEPETLGIISTRERLGDRGPTEPGPTEPGPTGTITAQRP